jgi:hypothetical protein
MATKGTFIFRRLIFHIALLLEICLRFDLDFVFLKIFETEMKRNKMVIDSQY